MVKFQRHQVFLYPLLKQFFFDTQQNQAIAMNFLQRYYSLYDSSDRRGLLDIYEENSYFSLSVSVPNQDKVSFETYMASSRNLKKMRENNDRFEYLLCGRLNVIQKISALPKTIHNLTESIIDVNYVHNVLLLSVSIHGNFFDVDTKTNRSFDRTFLLTPVPQGSKALADGWQAIIVNDKLHVRNYEQNTAGRQIMPAVTTTITTAAAPIPILQPQIVAQEVDATTKQIMVQELSKVSGMSPAFSEMCLVQNQWIYDLALTNFVSLQQSNSIPPEAFNK